MRKQIAAANWKMNLTSGQAKELTEQLLACSAELSNEQEVVLAVPFPYLAMIKQQVAGKKNFFIAAQNCYSKKSGAYTGEISAEMLHSIGADYVIIGHSERREYFDEDNDMLAQKISLAIEYDVKPIFCCGESLQIREAGTQNDFVETQISESLFHLTPERITNFVIAYEPIWAIGTGKTASSAQAQEIQMHIRNVLAAKYGDTVATTISILYGGSVKASNAKEIFSQPDVDGGLVGGASLVAQEFITIIAALKQ